MPDSKEKNSEKLSRLIRKEVASAVQPLLETVAALKQEVELLKQQTGTPAPTPKKKEKKNGKGEIVKLRRKLKLPKQKFAELFGVSKEEVNAWESGENQPEGKVAELLENLVAMDKKQRAAFLETIARKEKEKEER